MCSFPFSCSMYQMLARFLGPHLTRRTYYKRIHFCLFVSIKAAMDLLSRVILLRLDLFILLPSKPTLRKSSINLLWAEREGHKSVFLLIQSHQTVYWRTPLTEDTTNHVAHIAQKHILSEESIGVSAIVLPKGSPGRGGRVGLCKSVSGWHQKITEEPSEIASNNPVTLYEPTSTNQTITEILMWKKKNCLLRDAQCASLKKLKKGQVKELRHLPGCQKKPTTNIAWNR